MYSRGVKLLQVHQGPEHLCFMIASNWLGVLRTLASDLFVFAAQLYAFTTGLW